MFKSFQLKILATIPEIGGVTAVLLDMKCVRVYQPAMKRLQNEDVTLLKAAADLVEAGMPIYERQFTIMNLYQLAALISMGAWRNYEVFDHTLLEECNILLHSGNNLAEILHSHFQRKIPNEYMGSS